MGEAATSVVPRGTAGFAFEMDSCLVEGQIGVKNLGEAFRESNIPNPILAHD